MSDGFDKSVSDVVEENEERRSDLFAEYDPRDGTGSPIEREPVPLTPDHMIRVPAAMTEEPVIEEIWLAGSVTEHAEKHGEDPEDALSRFQMWRCEYDFEWWCATAANIELDTDSRKRRGIDVGPLFLNRAQRIYFKELYRQWVNEEPVRIILLKARQWGGSTLTQCFFAWVQRYHRSNWHSFICNLSLDQARNLRDMYDLLAEEYPACLGDDMTLRPYQGSSNVKVLEETGSIVGITSIERPDSPRSYNIHLAHLSEVGLWPSTPKVNAGDYAQAITGAVDNEPGTIIVEESTARGVGTYFHNHWQDAGKGESSYEQVFVAWHDIPKYTKEVEDEAAFAREYLRPGEETDSDDVEIARRLWRLGATLEGINWYFDELSEFKGDIRAMQNEYPSTPREAFQSTGRRFFTLDLTAKLRDQTKEPRDTGALRGAAVDGEEVFDKIEFVDLPAGEASLKVWRKPDAKLWWSGELITPPDKMVARRYGAFADFGGKTAEADWSVITIADRAKMLRGGPVEVVARLRVHMRPDLFAWASAQLAYWYNQALLAYEINRHRRDRGDEKRGFEPEWSLAVIEEIRGTYPNLYLRQVQDRVDKPVRYEVGFHTNASTKPMILNTLDASLDDTPDGQTYYDSDREFVDELDTFERKEDGRLGAVEGNYDDIVISSAGTSWLCLKHMDPPALVEPSGTPARPEPSAAQF